ncbi:S-adenosyl-L-methionine-dependent methyltransferase [Ganoderma leucocontextum]|nr:S-adenosyl-L-methionine-dependent methyltransferase [Ganoderma leucocontextum]
MDWKSKEFAAQYDRAEAMTGPFGRYLLTQCGLDGANGSEDLVLLDNATGTGIVLAHLYDVLPPATKERLQVVAGDISPAMIESAKARIEKNGWQGATAQVVDATKMDLPSNHFTHVITNFALVGVPDPRAALREVLRVLRPAGTAAFSIWKSVGWFDMTMAAVESIPDAPRYPTYEELCKVFLKDPQPGDDDQWTRPAYFEEQFRKAGFEEVKTVLRKNQTRYGSAEEYVKVFATMTNMVLANAWTADEKAKVEPHVEPALLGELKRKFGDGEIVLDWEAYCITAKVPATKA